MAVERRPVHDVVALLAIAADGVVLGEHRPPVGVVLGGLPQAAACRFS
jgi:hypothetical protein